jgi:uncharacterized protein
MKRIKPAGAAILAALVLFVLYAAYDNNRIVIREETVVIDHLPASFDGFTVLQISDLHSKRFGAGQRRLVNLINGLEYDMIAFTGDMIDYGQHDLSPFLELLDGIENKDHAFFVSGNTGPHDYDKFTGEKDQRSDVLESAGLILLDVPYRLEREDGHIWVADAFFRQRSQSFAQEPVLQSLYSEIELQRQVAYHSRLLEIFEDISERDVLMGVVHYPYRPQLLESSVNRLEPPYDLVLAGHYHGGQIRIPFYGALYIPDGTSTRRGFFPD